MAAVDARHGVTTGSRGRPGATTVLVVDDQRAFAEAVGLAIDSQRGLRCAGTVGSADEALAQVDVTCPDVVLLDLGLPGRSGLEAIALLRERCPAVRIVVLTADTSHRAVLGAIAAGADGFLPKDAPFLTIVEAVQSTDGLPVAEAILEQIVRLETPGPGAVPSTGADAGLTERENEVLQLLAQGRPVKQVARQLGISVHTCRAHVRAILQKLGAHSQLAAVVAAARRGLLDVGS